MTVSFKGRAQSCVFTLLEHHFFLERMVQPLDFSIENRLNFWEHTSWMARHTLRSRGNDPALIFMYISDRSIKDCHSDSTIAEV